MNHQPLQQQGMDGFVEEATGFLVIGLLLLSFGFIMVRIIQMPETQAKRLRRKFFKDRY